jgi:hypothetical protein
MDLLTANQVGRIRHAKLGGRDYIVAPLSMLVPGVLPGSKGPLYYPPDVVNRNPSVWNSIPIVVNHPMGINGPTSARDPDVLNRQEIGRVFNARKNGKAEGWFDVENTKRIEPRIYKALITNTPIELSTGLYTKHRKATTGSHYKGKPFDGVVTNMEPDHLAVLMDQTGACSLADGCGVLVNQKGEPMPSLLQRLANLFTANQETEEVDDEEEIIENEKHEELFSLTEDEIVELVANGWVTTKTGAHIFIGSGGQITKGPAGLKGKTIPGHGGGATPAKATESKPTEDLSQKSFGDLAKQYKAKTGEDPVGGMSRKDLIKRIGQKSTKTDTAASHQQQMEHHLGKQQEYATAAVAAQKAGNKPLAKALASQSESHANEIHVLKAKLDDLKPNMGAKTKLSSSETASQAKILSHKAFNESGSVKAHSDAGKAHREAAKGFAAGSKEHQYHTEQAMKHRSAVSQMYGLTGNSEGSQFGKPQSIKGEPNMAKLSKKKVTVNEDVELLDEDERNELVESIVGNCSCQEEDSLVLHSLSDETLAKLATMGLTNNAIPPQFMKGKKKAAPVEETETESEEVEDEEEVPVKNSKHKVAKKVTTNSKPKLDPETEMLVNYAKEKMQEERDELIEKLIVNADEEDVEELTETYNSMTIPQLKLMAKALPKAEEKVVQQPVINRRMDAQDVIQNRRNFAGAAGAITPSKQQKKAIVNNGKAVEPNFADAPLEHPTINHSEIAGFANGRFTHLGSGK